MKVMKLMIVLALAAGIVGFVLPSQSEAQRGYGMHHGMWGGGSGYGQDGGWSYCPYCGRSFGPRGGYPRGYGYDRRGEYRGGYPMGPGMMGPGYGMHGRGPGYRGYLDDNGFRPYREPLN